MLKSNTTRHLFNSEIFLKAVKCWLLFMLCFIPFQFYIVMTIAVWNSVLSTALRRLDLITIIVLFPVALIELYRTRRGTNWPILILLAAIIILSIAGLISGIVNGNSLLITFNGIFEYIKYFLVIFIFSAFFKKTDEFMKIYRYLLITTLCLATAAIIQELWADISRYIFDIDFNDRGIYLFQHMSTHTTITSFWRFGFYRVAAFMNSSIIFGLYSIFGLTIYLFINKEIRLPVVFLILLASALSFSRIVYFCTVILLIAQFIKGRKLLLIVVIPFLVISLFMSSMDDLNIWQLKDNIFAANDYENSGDNSSEASFRSDSRSIAIEIWKDHPMWGVGSGMFGGVVSVKYQSPVYSKYNLIPSNQHLRRIWGIDQFWFQFLAETGVVGIAAFVSLLISLILTFSYSKEKAESDELKGLFQGLMLYTLIIFIYSFGIKLNIVPVIFTYSAFAGVGLGCISNNKKDE